MKTKIKDKSNGAIIEVKKELVDDFIATGRYEIYKEESIVNESNVSKNKVGKYVSKIKNKL